MADGYARISRKVGVCGAQAIGSTNLAAGLRDAYMARTPVIALSGVPSEQAAYRNLYQDVDDHGAFESVTKWNATVPGPARFPDLLRQAFRSATSGVSRPVHLALVGRIGNQGDIAGRRASPAPSPGTASRRATARRPTRGRRRRGRAARPGQPAGHPGRERRGPLGRGGRPGRPGRAAPDPGGDVAERHGDDPRRPPAVRRRRRRVRRGRRQPDLAARRRGAGGRLLAGQHDHQDLEPHPAGRAE